ncbi:MAG TPA: hypothetical protein VHB50_06880 [Bryobacteraceae bacterium]|nr:hypothetical protein [Bryobacteraceae bacterium]
MEFKRARIEPEGQQAFDVLFNPNEYSVEKGNQLSETGIPGLQSPIIQYVHGNTRTLSLDLFFDTWEERRDVREHTNKVFALLGIEAETHVPPICKLSWGGFSFRCVLEKVSGKFNLFMPDGTPVRATLSVSFKEYIDVDVLVRSNPTQSADHTKMRLVAAGDRLTNIAYEEYGDARQWRPIAIANNIADPLRLEPGRSLTIPALE